MKKNKAWKVKTWNVKVWNLNDKKIKACNVNDIKSKSLEYSKVDLKVFFFFFNKLFTPLTESNLFQALWILQYKEVGVLSHHYSYETYPYCALMEV